MIEINLANETNQTFTCVLNGQDAVITLRVLNGLVYMDLVVNQTTIVLNELCHNRVVINLHKYKPLIGNLVFIDIEGQKDPIFSEFNSRYKLYYFTDELSIDRSGYVSKA